MSLPDDIALVAPERKAEILIDKLSVDARRYQRKKERSFTAREGLICAQFEVLLAAVAASNLARGVELTDEDRDRLWLASERLTTIAEEAVG